MIILKLGGSIITDKTKTCTVNQGNLNRIAREIADAKPKDLVIVHGAGSFGHHIAYEHNIQKGFYDDSQLMGFALTQKSMNDLNGYVLAALLREKLPAIPIQPSAFTLMEGGRVRQTTFAVVEKAVETGIIPVLYGVPALDTRKGFSILSGDEIIRCLAEKFTPERLLLATDVDGVMTTDPKTDRNAKKVPEITERTFHEIGFKDVEKDVTGGMRRKVEELLTLAALGVESQILNGNTLGNIRKALKGEVVGTIIR